MTGAADREHSDYGLSLQLCESIGEWRYEDLPQHVVRAVKLFLIDTLGVIAGAHGAPGIPELNRRLARWESGGSATGLLGKRRYSPPAAALANGAAAHALEFDDMHDAARVHGYCVVLPATLAAAEEAGSIDGRHFLLAAATGAELDARLGLACYNSLGRGWHPTVMLGVMAGAVAAGRVLSLRSKALLNALAIAFHQAGGTRESNDGALSKRLGPGFAARSAVLSAFLAADGLNGPRRPLEGEAGLFRLHERGEVDPSALTGGLREEWRLLDYCYKPFPSGHINHNIILLAVGLRNAGVRAVDVQEGVIYLGEVNASIVGKPYEPGVNPTIDAQFNACYSFARALLDGHVDLTSYTREAVLDPDLLALTRRTRVEVDPAMPARAMVHARVKVLLAGGRTLECRRDVMKGSPEDPLTEDEILAKFRHCMDFGLHASRAQADRLADTVLELEGYDNAAGAIVSAFPLPAP
jgi:2-methylcitrate dehydratase PrpD